MSKIDIESLNDELRTWELAIASESMDDPTFREQLIRRWCSLDFPPMGGSFSNVNKFGPLPTLLKLLDRDTPLLVHSLAQSQDGKSMLGKLSTVLKAEIDVDGIGLKIQSIKNYSGPYPAPMMQYTHDKKVFRIATDFLLAAEANGVESSLSEMSLARQHRNTSSEAVVCASLEQRGGKATPLVSIPSSSEKQLDGNAMYPKFKPADVFNGTQVRRKFVSKVSLYLNEHSTSVSSYFSGNMLNAKQGRVWEILGTKAIQTPSRWGRPSSLHIESEYLRAKILVALGVDITSSKIFKKYCST